LVGFRGQRLVVDGDEAGDVALGGFDDVFGGVAMVVAFAQKIAEGAVGLGGVLAVWMARRTRAVPSVVPPLWSRGHAGAGGMTICWLGVGG